ncbi:ABC transporter permease [Alicyclobacillus sp. SO9]|nr:ABC transporter permease [Alicyclobacillus sp. SO9]
MTRVHMSRWTRVLRIFWRNRLAKVGSFGLVFLILLCFVGPLVYPASPYDTHLQVILHSPTPSFPLGTNNLGRNELARLMLGGQTSLEVGFTAAAAAMVVGVIYGMVSGFYGGWLDIVLMRIIDLLRAIPNLFLLIFLDSVVRPSAVLLVVLISLTSWHGISRLVRGEVLSLKNEPFVEAARIAGASRLRIILRHFVPNTFGTILVAATFMVADAVLLVAGLSFLGLGLPPPAPNWGAMLANSMSYLPDNTWWLVYPPGLAILLTVLSINFIGDALRVALDERLDSKK